MAIGRTGAHRLPDELPARKAGGAALFGARNRESFQENLSGDLRREWRFMSEQNAPRTAVVFGVANKRSIAWAIAQQLHSAGWQLAITYQNERLAEEARDMILGLPGAEAFQCDVSRDEEIAQLFETLKTRYGTLYPLVHSVAFPPAEELNGASLNTTRDAFSLAHHVSVYSLIALARAAAPLMTAGGSILTMTYYGSTKVVPHYNVMGLAQTAVQPSCRHLA